MLYFSGPGTAPKVSLSVGRTVIGGGAGCFFLLDFEGLVEPKSFFSSLWQKENDVVFVLLNPTIIDLLSGYVVSLVLSRAHTYIYSPLR